MKPLYTAVATAHGGREGHVRSSDARLDIDLRAPKEMGGPGGEGTDASVTGRVTLSVLDSKYFLSVELEPQVDGLSAEETLALMRAAHEVCPYSNATRGNIDVRLSAR